MHSFHPRFRARAFTLVELLVVIVIIGLLTSLATTSYINAQRNSRDSARKVKVNTIATAIETYYRANQKFPGQNDVGTPDQSYTDATAGCEVYDTSTHSFVYAYYPTLFDPNAPLPTTSCDKRNSINNYQPITDSHGYTFRPSDYKPYPNWIPGIGDYINPTPVETRYQDKNGNQTAVFDPTDDINISNTNNNQRTFVYRKLSGGYMVYAILENNNDREALVAPYTISDSPKFTSGSNVIYGTNVYMVRK